MGPRVSFVLRRMGSVRMLLASVLLSALIAASLVAALAGFSASSLPQAVSDDLAQAPRTSIAIDGSFNARQVLADRPVVRATIRRAFGPIPVTIDEAVWSNPIGLPAPSGHRAVPLTEAAALGQIRGHVKLTAGIWPTAPVPGAPIQAAAPVTIAGALHLRLGEVLLLRDRLTGAKVSFRLTGLYQPLNPAAPYWGVDLIAPSGVSVQTGFITYGPLIVAQGAFSSSLAIGGATWLAVPGTTRIDARQLEPLAGRVSHALAYLTSSPDLGGLQVSSGLPAALSGVATKLVVARSLLAVGELELLLLAGAALTLTARTLANQREDEVAVLTARGAGRWQLVRLALVEVLLVTTVAAAAGVLVGSRLAGLVASFGQLRVAGLRVRGIPAQVWWTVGAVLLLCTAIMLWPALHAVTPGAAKVRRGRQAAVSAVAKAGGDVALVLLAVLLGWQLRQYSLLGRTAGGIGIDPVLALAPVIALGAATVLPLRLLPVLARAADRLAARTRHFGTAMTSWEISRRAARQSAPILLVVLAVGAGTLALAQHQSWHQSALDQSAFAAGADVRAVMIAPLPLGRSAGVAHARGVTGATAVTTGLAVPNGGQVLALDSRNAPATVLLRADESALPAATLWRRVRPARSPGAAMLPGRPARLEIIASMNPGPGPDLGRVYVSASIQDASGVVFSVPAGVLPDDGHSHGLIAVLSRTRQAIYPLKLLAVSLAYTLPPVPPRQRMALAANRTAAFAVRGLAVSAALRGGFAAVSASGRTLARWLPAVSAQQLQDFGVGSPPLLDTQPGAHGTGIVTFHPGDGHISPFAGPFAPIEPVPGQLTLTVPVPFTVIPGIATQAFLRSSHLAVGDLLQVAAGPAAITVHIVAAVAGFPTVTSPDGGLIVDQGAAQDIMAALSAPPLTVTEWWLATRTGSVPAGLPAGTIVTDRAALFAALQADPLSAIPQQAVQSIAVAATLLAILGFSVSVAGNVRERRPQSALLAALGVNGAAQARLLCLEALALSLPAAATGLLLGVVLAHLLVPAVTLTAAAAAPVPPVLVEVPLAAAAALALVIAAVPVIAAGVTAASRPDPAAQLRAAEAI